MLRRVLFTALTLAWMGVIFSMSAAPAVESADMSQSFGYWIAPCLKPEFADLSPEQQQAFVDRLEYPIRKGAHFGEYMVLGVLLFECLLAWGGSSKKAWRLAIMIGVLYAASDEVHQLFVDGRSGQFSDVCLDSFGALTGAAAAAWIHGFRSAKSGIFD